MGLFGHEIKRDGGWFNCDNHIGGKFDRLKDSKEIREHILSETTIKSWGERSNPTKFYDPLPVLITNFHFN